MWGAAFVIDAPHSWSDKKFTHDSLAQALFNANVYRE